MLIVNVVVNNIRNILTFIFFLSVPQTHAGQIWFEQFLTPDKGIWGDENGQTIHSDFSGVLNWLLEYENLSLTASDDYAKTVATSGGRFEVRDIDGVVTWRSEWIKIHGYGNVSASLTAYETGSGSNEESKYLKAYFRLDGGTEILFKTNGLNAGNWGLSSVEQNGLNGDSLQIVVYMANAYASDKVTLDEVLVTGEEGDNLAPFITDVEVKSADSLAVYFNEPLDPESINKENFNLLSADGAVPVLSVSGFQTNSLFLSIPSVNRVALTLVISEIADLAGNIAEADSFSFSYLPPVHPGDVVINEIMADPSPPQLLPEYEYIELLNRADYPVQLNGWKLGVDESEKALDEFILLPGHYVILTSTGAAGHLSGFGDILAVKSFPSIRNKGAAICLTSGEGELIDQICYSDDWPLNPEKSEGGWSVERIDPGRFCGQSDNWKYSLSPDGGTPGFENSVESENQDTQPPALIKAEPLDPSSLEIAFSEPMDTFLLKDPQNYWVPDGPGHPGSVLLNSPESASLFFPVSFTEDKNYTVAINGLTDECGNSPEESGVWFTWSVARPGDIVINEVLSKPYPEGTDFVEFYNNSAKDIYLDHLWFSNGKDTVPLKSFSGKEVIFYSQSYLICTKDSAKAAQPYFSSCPRNIIEIDRFPAIYNDDGEVHLMNENFETIDRFYYSEELQSPFLSETAGVSLERVSFTAGTSERNNWHSAAESVGYATPGCENSQAGKGFETSVSFEPESFSPNQDGYHDEYHINYQLNSPGYVANAWVFDAAGRLILQLAKNEILATQGTITWGGKNETGQILLPGVYVVLVEMFDLNGNINRYKDAVVLTDILK